MFDSRYYDARGAPTTSSGGHDNYLVINAIWRTTIQAIASSNDSYKNTYKNTKKS